MTPVNPYAMRTNFSDSDLRTPHDRAIERTRKSMASNQNPCKSLKQMENLVYELYRMNHYDTVKAVTHILDTKNPIKVADVHFVGDGHEVITRRIAVITHEIHTVHAPQCDATKPPVLKTSLPSGLFSAVFSQDIGSIVH